MYKEIDLGNKNKLVFYRDIDFWGEVLSSKIKNAPKIDIVTYNFNFEYKEGKSFYNRLIELAEKGINIRLMYCPDKSEDVHIEEIFSNEILCVRIPNNHSKIFWCEIWIMAIREVATFDES